MLKRAKRAVINGRLSEAVEITNRALALLSREGSRKMLDTPLVEW